MARALVALMVVGLLGAMGVSPAGAEAKVGTMLDQSTADEASELLPPEILKHFKNGDYMNKVVEFPASQWKWDDGFLEATKQNGERIVLDEHKSPVDKTTHQR